MAETKQDDSDQWPESLRIMREQRERIAELEAALQDNTYPTREAALEETLRQVRLALRLQADADLIPMLEAVHGLRDRIAELEAEVERLTADAERQFTAAELSRIKTLLDNRPIDVHRDFYREELDEGIINKIDAARAAGGER